MYSCYVQTRYKNKLDERILSQLIEKSPLRNLVSYRIPKLLYLTFPRTHKGCSFYLPGEYVKVVGEFKGIHSNTIITQILNSFLLCIKEWIWK